MTISAHDAFDKEAILADWERLGQAHIAWLRATEFGSPVTSKMPWRGTVTQTPEGESDARALNDYAWELTAKYPEIHIAVHNGERSVNNYGAGVVTRRMRP